MNAILDTNAIYYLDSKLSAAEFEKIEQKIKRSELKIYISPITVIEMTSRLKEKPADFKKVQDAIKKLFLLSPSFLPDPEQQLTEYVLNSKIAENDYKHWKEIFYTIKVATSITALETGFDDHSTQTKRSVDLTKIYTIRKEYESFYVSDMETPLKTIIPDFEIKIAKNKNTRLPKDKVYDFKKYLESSNWINQLKLMLIARTLLPLPNDATEIQNIFEKIHFFKKSYEDLFIKIFEDGYIPNMKRKNDFNDWHFNVYFNNSNDYIFITSENNVVFNELKIKDRCKDIMDLTK